MTVKGPVPPVHETWTLSEVLVLVGLVANEPRETEDGVAFTVTVIALEVTVTGVFALSVTCSSKFQAPVVASAPVGSV